MIRVVRASAVFYEPYTAGVPVGDIYAVLAEHLKTR